MKKNECKLCEGKKFNKETIDAIKEAKDMVAKAQMKKNKKKKKGGNK